MCFSAPTTPDPSSRPTSAYLINPLTPHRPSSGTLSDNEQVLSSLTFKVGIVGALILAAITITAGVLALMVSKGGLPSGMNSVNHLRVIGEVNSYVMICAGIGLFVISMLAWGYHKDENRNRSSIKQLQF